MTLILILAAIALCAILGAVVALWITDTEWWRDRKLGPPTKDTCVICGRVLRERERIEVLHGGAYDSEFGGFSGLIATYDREHAPEGADV